MDAMGRSLSTVAAIRPVTVYEPGAMLEYAPPFPTVP